MQSLLGRGQAHLHVIQCGGRGEEKQIISTVLFTFTCGTCFQTYLPDHIDLKSLENTVSSSHIILRLWRGPDILHLSSGILNDFGVFPKSYLKAGEMTEIAGVSCVSNITYICIL